jgi:hypothetical protein
MPKHRREIGLFSTGGVLGFALGAIFSDVVVRSFWAATAALCAVLFPHDPPIRLNLSAQIPACETGFVSRILERAGLIVTLNGGAERAYICDSKMIATTKALIVRRIGELYPGCFRVGVDSSIDLIRASNAVCQAPYILQSNKISIAPERGGIFLCIGEAGAKSASFESGRSEVRPCEDAELARFGFPLPAKSQ